MPETDFFRQPLAQMIDPRHPLAVLASRLPWTQIEAALAPRFARQVRPGPRVRHLQPDSRPRALAWVI